MDQSGSLAKDKRSIEGKWVNVYDQVQEMAQILCSLKTLPTYIGNAEGESKNGINELPNCVLLSILSLLTLKDAVTTGMICRRWRDLWKDLWLTSPNLELDIPNIFGSQYARLIDMHEQDYDYLRLKRFERQQFVSGVNTILGLYLGKKVESFKLAFFLDGEYTRDLDNWVHFAITNGAQVLHLHLRGGIETVYHFPYWILTESDSLGIKHLSLENCILSPPPSFDRFNELTTLCLDNVTMAIGEMFMAHLFSVCVVLESLTLKSCSMDPRLVVAAGHQPLRLQELKLIQCCQLEEVVIDAVNLTSLEFEGNILMVHYMETPRLLSVFLCARCRFTLPRELTIFSFVPALENLHLRMWHGVELPKSVPKFGNLRLLNLESWKFDKGNLFSILKATPLLEELVLTVYASHINQRNIRMVSGFSHDHLKKVKLQRFHSNSHMIKLAICILGIASKLEMMVIDPLGKIYMGGGVWQECYRNEEEDEYSDEDGGGVDGSEDEEEEEILEEEVEVLEEEEEEEDEEEEEVLEEEVEVLEEEEEEEEEDEEEDEEEEEEEDEEEDEEEEEDEKQSNSSWEEKGRAIVQEKLMEVMTDARIIIL